MLVVFRVALFLLAKVQRYLQRIISDFLDEGLATEPVCPPEEYEAQLETMGRTVGKRKGDLPIAAALICFIRSNCLDWPRKALLSTEYKMALKVSSLGGWVFTVSLWSDADKKQPRVKSKQQDDIPRQNHLQYSASCIALVSRSDAFLASLACFVFSASFPPPFSDEAKNTVSVSTKRLKANIHRRGP